MSTPKEIIHIGQLELRFLLDGNDTNNQMVMFELIIAPNAKVPVPHFHVDVDEALYGLEGVLTSTVDGKKIITTLVTIYLLSGDWCITTKIWGQKFLKRSVC